MSITRGIQFAANGPFIPFELIKAREEGTLVFFCGAGISMGAGLPNFNGLVCQTLNKLNVTLSLDEKDAFKSGNYELVFESLEKKYNKADTRKSVIESINEMNKKKLDVHKSILDLAKNKCEGYNIVTTNYDHGFIYHNRKKVPYLKAPNIGIPRSDLWKNLVYLHGLIDLKEDPSGEELILTSSDFGRAYLTERWASRFITELFRKYTVLFIGYSINDVIVRYLMDAIGAARQRGELLNRAYIIDEYRNEHSIEIKKNRKSLEESWFNRGMAPLVYENTNNDFKPQSNTLKNWSLAVSTGITGKQAIIKAHGQKPNSLSLENLEVNDQQVLWALKDKSGTPAKTFSLLDPLPSIEWLPFFERHGLLAIYNLENTQFAESNPFHSDWHFEVNTFSFIRHPWADPLMDWFCRHLDEYTIQKDMYELDSLHCPALKFALRENGIIHPILAEKILTHLSHHKIKEPFGKAWSIIAKQSLIPRRNRMDLWHTHHQYLKQNIDLGRVLDDIERGLDPIVRIRTPFTQHVSGQVLFKTLLDIDINEDHNSLDMYNLKELFKGSDELLKAAFPILFSALEKIWRLMDNFELFHSYESSSFDRPSIAPHNQNRHSANSTLIDSFYYSAKSIADENPFLLFPYIQQCSLSKYSFFRRIKLCLYNLAIEDSDMRAAALSYVSKSKDILWRTEYGVELFALIRSFITKSIIDKLFPIILAGPSIDKDDTENTQRDIERKQHLLLFKIKEHGGHFDEPTQLFFDKLTVTFEIADQLKGEQSEFSCYMGPSGCVEEMPFADVDWKGLSVDDVANHISKKGDFFHEYFRSWKSYFKTSPNIINALLILENMLLNHSQNENLTDLIQVIHDKCFKSQLNTFWKKLLLQPPERLQECIHVISRLAEDDAIKLSRTLYCKVFDHILEICLKSGSGLLDGEVFNLALNHPIGHISMGLLHAQWKKQPQYQQKFLKQIRSRLIRVFISEKDSAFYGKMMIVSKSGLVNWIDPEFFDEYCLELFSWENQAQAHSFWSSLLMTNRIDKELSTKLKEHLVQCYNHLGDFNDEGSHELSKLIQYFVLSALDKDQLFDDNEINHIFSLLNADHLSIAIKYIYHRLLSSKERSVTWNESIKPFLRFWPKERNKVNQKICYHFALIICTLDEKYAEVMNKFGSFLFEIDHHSFNNYSQEFNHFNNLPIYENSPESLLKVILVLMPRCKPSQHEAWKIREAVELAKKIGTDYPNLKQSEDYKKIINILISWGVDI
jgi:hypothetical protein